MKTRKIFGRVLLLGAVAFASVLWLQGVVLAGGNPHVHEAISHAEEAVDHGNQGHADAVVSHAKAALGDVGESFFDVFEDRGVGDIFTVDLYRSIGRGAESDETVGKLTLAISGNTGDADHLTAPNL